MAASGLSINRKVTDTFTDIDGEITLTNTFATNWSGGTTFVGVVLGGGFQYALSESLSLGVEYLHAEYADSDMTVSGNFTHTTCDSANGCSASSTERFRSNATDQFGTDTVRAVLNYKFGSRAEYVPLK